MQTYLDLWGPMETHGELLAPIELLFLPSLMFFHRSPMLYQDLSDIFHHSIQIPLCKYDLSHQISDIRPFTHPCGAVAHFLNYTLSWWKCTSQLACPSCVHALW